MLRAVKILLFAFLAVSFAQVAQAQATGDSHADRIAAAQKLLKVQSMETMMMELMENIGRTMPEEQRKVFMEMMREEYDIPALESAAINSMVKIFTAREIEALAVFYGSPEGQSIQRKLGPYMAEIMPVIQKSALEAVQRYMQKMQKQQHAPQSR